MPFDVQRALLTGLRARPAFVSIDPHLPVTEERSTSGGKSWRTPTRSFRAKMNSCSRGARDPHRALPRLVNGRLRFVVFKRGAKGGILYDAHDERFYSWDARAVAVVDQTGAGDAFAVGLVLAHLEGLPIEACLQRAVVTASFAVAGWGPEALLAATRADAEPGCVSGTAARGSGEGLCECGDEVARALAIKAPVVALETRSSRTVCHPDGVTTALSLEQIVREAGATPATIGIIGGAIRIGLTRTELEQLATTPNVAKINLSNLAAAVHPVCPARRPWRPRCSPHMQAGYGVRHRRHRRGASRRVGKR